MLFNRHCLLFYSVYIVHVSTILFALIVTGYYFTVVYIVHVFKSLIRFNRHCLLFYSVYIVHISTLLFALFVTAYYFILYVLFMFQLSYSFKSSQLIVLICIYFFMFQLSYSLSSSLLTILFCIYFSCFNSLVRFNRHCLLFYLVYIVHVSTLLFALIVTAYYFILCILFMFQLSYSF